MINMTRVKIANSYKHFVQHPSFMLWIGTGLNFLLSLSNENQNKEINERKNERKMKFSQ